MAATKKQRIKKLAKDLSKTHPTQKRKSLKRIAKEIVNLIPGQNKVDWESETKRMIDHILQNGIKMIYIDLFCGFGGTTAGVAKAKNKTGKEFAFVILGINHDDIALACHKVHNPHTLHLREDIREVIMAPIAKMVAAIRKACPGIMVVIWTSAECTHHSRAKGGDSRDPDSRSQAEELERYQEAIKPDLIQVENVTEFRSWGPLKQKVFDMKLIDLRKCRKKTVHPEYGILHYKNKTVLIDKKGLAFKKNKKQGIVPWMIPIPERKAEYFNEWRDHLKALGYNYEDRDVNAADHGAFTARNRYYGQFSSGIPIIWPNKTHCKDPDKHMLRFGYKLLKHNAVKEVLDFADTGDSIFVPGRIKSDQTFKRLFEGAIKHIAGGKKQFSEAKKQYDKWVELGELPTSQNEPVTNEFMVKHFGGKPENKSYSINGPAHNITNIDHNAKVHAQVLPFIIQFNNNCDLNSVDEPSKVLTQRDKFGSVSFIQQRNTGKPSSKIVSVDGPARTITGTGGNQDLVQVEKILPYISNYHGSGHNCFNVNNPGPAVCCADIHSLVSPQPFIFRQFSNGGQNQSINVPAGSMPAVPKMNLISAKWIMDTNYNNIGYGIDGPARVITADRHHAYIVNPSYFGHSTSIDKPSPVVVARQDKAPLHLAQVHYGDQAYYGIVIYNSDSPEVKELKYFMAIYGIVDIKMRMLKEEELLPIQGFDPNYIEKVREFGIKVSGTAAKKYIGNSQEVKTAQGFVEGYAPHLDFFKLKNVA